ncbi:MAG: hypothetical protein Q8O88_04275 [bacterium]|nr:hypothetical protein [bacterium]
MLKSDPKEGANNESLTQILEEITDGEKTAEVSWDEEWHPDFSL